MNIETLSAQLHDVYIKEAKRQGDVRHKDAYEELPENIKEYDRVLARHIVSLLQDQLTEATAYKYGFQDGTREALTEVEKVVKNEMSDLEKIANIFADDFNDGQKSALQFCLSHLEVRKSELQAHE